MKYYCDAIFNVTEKSSCNICGNHLPEGLPSKTKTNYHSDGLVGMFKNEGSDNKIKEIEKEEDDGSKTNIFLFS